MPNEKPKEEEIDNENEELDLESKINVAIRAQLKREMKPLADQFKSFSESVTKSLDGFKQQIVAAPPPAPGKEGDKSKAPAADPKYAELEEKLAKFMESTKAAEERAKQSEERERKKDTHNTVRAALEAKGIKGAKATAVIAMWEVTGTLKYDDDGKPIIVTSRSRSKGAEATELEYESLSKGVEDWAKCDDAADFLPAPGKSSGSSSDTKAPARREKASAPRRDSPALSDHEMVNRTVQDLEAKGINIDSLID